MKTIAIILCLAVLLGACGKKDEDQSLTITVVEYGTQKPIPNVGIKVYYRQYNGNYSGSDVYYDSVVTNSQGRAFIDGNEHRPDMIRLYTNDSSYYDQWSGGANGELDLSVVKRNNNIAELTPHAWTKIRFVKVSKDIDYIRVGNLAGEIYGFTIYTKDTIVGGQTLGNKPETIYIYPYKDGQAQAVKHDTIYSPGHDTSYHEIRW